MEQHDVKLKVHIEADGMEALAPPRGRRGADGSGGGGSAPDNGAAPGGGGAVPPIPGADPNPPERAEPNDDRNRNARHKPVWAPIPGFDRHGQPIPPDYGPEPRRPSPAAVGREVTDLLVSARRGTLGDAATELAGEAVGMIPGGKLAFRGALIAERYGPATAAAFDAAVPEQFRPATRAALGFAERTVRDLGAARSSLNAIGAAADTTMDIAAQDMIFAGSVDPVWLTENARREYLMAAEIESYQRNLRILGSEAAGAAIGDALGQMMSGSALFAVGK